MEEKYVWKKDEYDWKIALSEEESGETFTATVKRAKNKIDSFHKKYPGHGYLLFRIDAFEGLCEEVGADELYDLFGY